MGGELAADNKPSPEALAAELADFDSLVADIRDNPELLMTTELTDEQILELHRRENPYTVVSKAESDNPEIIKTAAISYTNLQEDYIRRYTATSFVGFIYQVLGEWTVPAEQRRWVPKSTKGNGGNDAPFNPTDLVTQLEATLAIAKEAEAAHNAAEALTMDATAMDSKLPSESTDTERADIEGKYAEASGAAARAAGLLYAATHATHRAGKEAKLRLRATSDECMKYPEVRNVIKKYPIPATAGQIEMPQKLAKSIIQKFLNNWLRYDPNIHIRSNKKSELSSIETIRVGKAKVKVDTADPKRITLAALCRDAPPPLPEHEEALKIIMESQSSYNAAVAILRSDDLLDSVLTSVSDDNARTAFMAYLLPVSKSSPVRAATEIVPQDTFHRWNYYAEVNCEKLRTVTETLYPERPEMDFCLAVWDTFEGDEKEVQAAFDKYCQRYQDEIRRPIKMVQLRQYAFLADFAENRKNVQFYNKNTEVLKRILDRHADDQRVGADLMRNRVRQTKARNVAESGPDAPGLAGYKRNASENKQDLSSRGVEKVISAEEMRRLEKAGGSIKAAKELELLDQYEATIARLGELKSLRTLTLDEETELSVATDNIVRAREMVEVPEGAIQVDVFTNDTRDGGAGFGKAHFYSKADAPDDAKSLRSPRSTNESSHPAAVKSALQQRSASK
jgi:hypothetical protein